MSGSVGETMNVTIKAGGMEKVKHNLSRGWCQLMDQTDRCVDYSSGWTEKNVSVFAYKTIEEGCRVFDVMKKLKQHSNMNHYCIANSGAIKSSVDGEVVIVTQPVSHLFQDYVKNMLMTTTSSRVLGVRRTTNLFSKMYLPVIQFLRAAHKEGCHHGRLCEGVFVRFIEKKGKDKKKSKDSDPIICYSNFGEPMLSLQDGIKKDFEDLISMIRSNDNNIGAVPEFADFLKQVNNLPTSMHPGCDEIITLNRYWVLYNHILFWDSDMIKLMIYTLVEFQTNSYAKFVNLFTLNADECDVGEWWTQIQEGELWEKVYTYDRVRRGNKYDNDKYMLVNFLRNAIQHNMYKGTYETIIADFKERWPFAISQMYAQIEAILLGPSTDKEILKTSLIDFKPTAFV